MQIELTQIDGVCDAVVQSSVIINDIVNHPGCGRPAYDKNYILAERSPCVPKMPQSTHKPRLGRVKTWQLVNIYDTSSILRLWFQ